MSSSMRTVALGVAAGLLLVSCSAPATDGAGANSAAPAAMDTAPATSSTEASTEDRAPGASSSTTTATTTTVTVTTTTGATATTVTATTTTGATTTTTTGATATTTTAASTTTTGATATTTTAASATTTMSAPSPWGTGISWAWLLQGGPVPNLDVDVIDVDLFDTPASEVARTEARGVRTVCYLSAGTWEDYRPDAGDYPEEILGNNWDEWDERFVDIRRLDLLGPILEARLDLCAAKGFSAVEPDNIDTYWEDTGFDLTASDALAFAQWFARQAHARGLVVAQKNAPELAGRLVGFFDFAITEDCFDDGWCADMGPYDRAGKAILDAEYTDRMGSLGSTLCSQADELGVSVLLANRNLTRNIERCP